MYNKVLDITSLKPGPLNYQIRAVPPGGVVANELKISSRCGVGLIDGDAAVTFE